MVSLLLCVASNLFTITNHRHSLSHYHIQTNIDVSTASFFIYVLTNAYQPLSNFQLYQSINTAKNHLFLSVYGITFM